MRLSNHFISVHEKKYHCLSSNEWTCVCFTIVLIFCLAIVIGYASLVAKKLQMRGRISNTWLGPSSWLRFWWEQGDLYISKSCLCKMLIVWSFLLLFCAHLPAGMAYIFNLRGLLSHVFDNSFHSTDCRIAWQLFMHMEAKWYKKYIPVSWGYLS